MACYSCQCGWLGWRACMDDMLLLLLLLLLKYYLEENNFECLLLKEKSKIVPNRSEKLFKNEPDFKGSSCFTLIEAVMSGS